ncbi:MAG: histidine phosphatase family protein [Pseudomonadota bacterium]
MGEVVIIRHGQANSAAKDEASYDILSELGHRQAGWLGEWMAAQNETFDAAFVGTMRRHRETAVGMGQAEEALRADARFNEMDYFNLSEAMRNAFDVPLPENDRDFYHHVPKLMEAWERAEIQGNESFASFETRVTEAIRDVAQEGRRVLVVTSGGVIGMIVRHVLNLDPRRMAHILLPVRNSSVHRLQVVGDDMFLSGFNATPHLDAPDRAFARTTY